MTAPARTFRILRGPAAPVCAVYYKTAAARDAAAARFAKLDGQNVALEEWSLDHPQDELNAGWACTGAVYA